MSKRVKAGRPGAPKGSRNNPAGRPKKVDAKRQGQFVRLDTRSAEALEKVKAASECDASEAIRASLVVAAGNLDSVKSVVAARRSPAQERQA